MNSRHPEKENKTNPKDLIGQNKSPLSLVPTSVIIHLAEVFRNGAIKYGKYNWRENKVVASIYIDAAMRHILAYLDGEDFAEDSKLLHISHAIGSLSVLLDALESDNLVDDRPTKGPAAELLKRFNRNNADSTKSTNSDQDILLTEKEFTNFINISAQSDPNVSYKIVDTLGNLADIPFFDDQGREITFDEHGNKVLHDYDHNKREEDIHLLERLADSRREKQLDKQLHEHCLETRQRGSRPSLQHTKDCFAARLANNTLDPTNLEDREYLEHLNNSNESQ